jgi:cytidylate kinase
MSDAGAGSGNPSGSFVVTIDGPAGAGKSTAARQLAARLGYSFLDTGAIYRTVALLARQRGIDWGDGPALGALAGGIDLRFESVGGANRVIADGADVTGEIRTPAISEGASRVSAHPPVRAALLQLQRAIGARGRVVAEGRDTGTAVFPDAPAKFFLTASPAERARRRTLELTAAGRAAVEADVLAEMEQRDQRDSTRAASPLRRAEDAVEIDTSGLSADEVVDLIEGIVRSRGG